MSYGTPRATLADCEVICLNCAVEQYLRIPKDSILESDRQIIIGRINEGKLLDRQGEKISLLLEGQHDVYLHTEYCPLCSSEICSPGCDCYKVDDAICPFCAEEFDAEKHIKKGHYDYFHGFYCHVECLELGIETIRDEIYCSEHAKGKKRVRVLSLQSDTIETMQCQDCNEFLLEDTMKIEFFGDSDWCECETCEKVAFYALHVNNAITIDGYRLGVEGYTPDQHGLASVLDYARFLGYETKMDVDAFCVGFIQGKKEM